MRKPIHFLLWIIALSIEINPTESLDNGLGRTPPMGWNSWNHFGCGVNETIVRDTIDRFVQLNLTRFGYEYVNIDDCWAGFRDSEGFIHPDPKTFPSGMKALADYAHSKGLKFGLYSDAGTLTCARRPGSLGYERKDAQTYASWGIDFLKYDNCFNDGTPERKRYPIMSKALLESGRKIFFAMCETGRDDPTEWAPQIANSWRTTKDVENFWHSVMLNILLNDAGASAARPGAWNDPDMLEIGNGNLNYNQSKVHFSLWAIAKAPLIIGCDLSKITPETLSILTNEEVIAVNQDALGQQGRIVDRRVNRTIWKGRLKDGSFAIVVVSFSGDLKALLDFGVLFGDSNSKFSIRDIWDRKDLGVYNGSFLTPTVPSQGCVFYRIKKIQRE